MTPQRQALADYLTIHRALGYKLGRPGALLAQFVAYLDDVGADTITAEHALAWARLPADGDLSWSVLLLFPRGATLSGAVDGAPRL